MNRSSKSFIYKRETNTSYYRIPDDVARFIFNLHVNGLLYYWDYDSRYADDLKEVDSDAVYEKGVFKDNCWTFYLDTTFAREIVYANQDIFGKSKNLVSHKNVVAISRDVALIIAFVSLLYCVPIPIMFEYQPEDYNVKTGGIYIMCTDIKQLMDFPTSSGDNKIFLNKRMLKKNTKAIQEKGGPMFIDAYKKVIMPLYGIVS